MLEQPVPDGADVGRVPRHLLSRHHGGLLDRQDLGRAAVLRADLRAARRCRCCVLVVFGPMLMWKRDSAARASLRPAALPLRRRPASRSPRGLVAVGVAAASRGRRPGAGRRGWSFGAAAILVRRWARQRHVAQGADDAAGDLRPGARACRPGHPRRRRDGDVDVADVEDPRHAARRRRVAIGPATIRLDGLREALGPNYVTLIASVHAGARRRRAAAGVGAALLSRQPDADDAGGHRLVPRRQHLCRGRRGPGRAASWCALTTIRWSAGSGPARC